MTDPSTVQPSPGALRFRRAFLLSLTVGISVLFLLVIQRFILAVFLAAVFAGLVHPLYHWILGRMGGRKNLAAMATLILLLVGVGVPLAGFLALVAAEAVHVSQGAEAWFRDQAGRIDQIRGFLERIPLADRILPEAHQVAAQFREIAGRTGPVLMGALAAATRGTLNFILQAFILLYALFYFLVDGPVILQRILHYIPLAPEEKAQLLERFVSVSRATLRGSLLIGVIQGGIAGLAFWVAGVPGPAFWGTVMVVLSIIPAVGAALIWIPAVIYLFMVGEVVAGVGLLVWCAVVVSTVDNFLRPRLIGRDARMSDLLILLSTLGGIILFGAVGFIVGPIVAALFVTVWHLYGEAFQEWLPHVPARVLPEPTPNPEAEAPDASPPG
jgi:predicted PurR-regulated permease PerM